MNPELRVWGASGEGNFSDKALPQVLADLPTTPDVLRVSGQFCAELFCGDAAITLSLTFESAPCICPWDRAYGVQCDVVAHERAFFALADDGRLMLVHLGVPCQSLTWARTPSVPGKLFGTCTM